MSTKFEQLLDLLVNEEHDKANELFHEIVVEKSREIYENLIAEEAEDEEMDEASEDDEEAVEEASEDDEEDLEEGFGEEEPMDAEEPEVGGDATDDFVSSVDADGEEGGDEAPATKSDVQDLEDALEELKAEFEKLMAGEEAEEEEHPGIHGEPGLLGDEEDSEGDEEDSDDEEDAEEAFQFGEGRQVTREYREKVGNDWDKNSQKTDGQIAGANTGEKMPTASSGKSPVSSGAGKPTSGASAKNIARLMSSGL